MPPKISIIVPVYNAEAFLPDCIEHILSQSFADFELILVDNGSTDASLSVCEAYAQKDRRIKVLPEEKRGVSHARNAGMQTANGEWLCFCDADDWMDKDYLALFMDNCSSKEELVIQGFNSVDGKNVIHYGFHYYGTPDKAIILLMQYPMPGVVWNKLFHRDTIVENHLKFDPRIHFKEDEEFLLKYMLCVKRVRSVEHGCYYYNVPNLTTKYEKYDNFHVHLSIFNSTRTIIDLEKETDNVSWIKHNLCLLCNAYFNSFNIQCSDLENRYSLFRAEVHSFLKLIPELSIYSKLVIRYVGNARLATCLFRCKSSFSALLHR